MKRKTREAYVPQPIDHIPDGSGIHADQLADLSDEELADQVLYYRTEKDASPEEGRARWGWAKLLSSALSEVQYRSNAPV